MHPIRHQSVITASIKTIRSQSVIPASIKTIHSQTAQHAKILSNCSQPAQNALTQDLHFLNANIVQTVCMAIPNALNVLILY